MKKLLLSVGIAAAILAGCNNSSSGGGLVPVPPPATTAPATTAPATTAPATTAPATTAPATTAPATTAPATSAPATTAPATSAPATALTLTYYSSTLLAPNNAAPGIPGPINLFAAGQTATIVPAGGVAPYSAVLNNCSTGGGFNPSATLSQNVGLNTFTVTATGFAGSCNVVVTDSGTGSAQKSAIIQEITTISTGTVS